MHVWGRTGIAIAISLHALPASAVQASGTTNVSVNSPEQIRKAQNELRRLDCLRGPVDGKLGDQTRQAVKKFWKSAGQPAVDITITDELVSDLADRRCGFLQAGAAILCGRIASSPGRSAPPFMRGLRPPYGRARRSGNRAAGCTNIKGRPSWAGPALVLGARRFVLRHRRLHAIGRERHAADAHAGGVEDRVGDRGRQRPHRRLAGARGRRRRAG